MASPNARAAGIALLAMGLYATHDVIIKVLGGRYPPLQILFFASLLSFPLITVILLRDRTNGTLRPAHPLMMTVRSACIVLGGICGFYAFSVLPMAQVYALLFAAPLLVTILSIPVLGERVGVHRWAAVVIGLTGVLVVLRPGGGEGLSLGHAAGLLAAASSALAWVIVRKLGRSERAVVMLLWPMLGNFAVTGASLIWAYTPMRLGDLALAGGIAGLGLIAAFLVIRAYQIGEAAMVAPMQYSQILWATVYGWLFFAEMPDRATLAGAGIIIASGLYIVWREGRGGNSAHRPVIAGRMRPETVTSPKSSLLQRFWPGSRVED